MGAASDIYADLIHQQYSDWRSRYFPKIQQLMGESRSNALMRGQLARTDALAVNSLRAAHTGTQNQMARYGVTRPPNAQDNTSSLRAALSVAGAKNGIREAQQDRRLNILTGGAAPVRKQLDIGGGGT